MIRGNPHALGAKVEPGFPVVLELRRAEDPRAGRRAPQQRPAHGAGRLDRPQGQSDDGPRPGQPPLAVSTSAAASSATSNDFGKLGELPTHPELLDWLAAEFTRGDWQLKRMHRLMMLSSDLSPVVEGRRPRALANDPGNSLCWRVPMRRLTAEEVRDSILAVDGPAEPHDGRAQRLSADPARGARRPVRPGSGWGTSSPEEQARRSVYVHVKRSLQVPILANHDQADTDCSCAVRYTTTVPTQALGHAQRRVHQRAGAALAAPARREAPDDLNAQVRRAIRLTTGALRRPTRCRATWPSSARRRRRTARRTKALTLYCLLALNANEFMYLD